MAAFRNPATRLQEQLVHPKYLSGQWYWIPETAKMKMCSTLVISGVNTYSTLPIRKLWCESLKNCTIKNIVCLFSARLGAFYPVTDISNLTNAALIVESNSAVLMPQGVANRRDDLALTSKQISLHLTSETQLLRIKATTDAHSNSFFKPKW